MEPYVLRRDEGAAIWMFDALDTIKADSSRTGGSFTFFEFLDFEGSTVPLHSNERWDRGFYVLEGRYTFVIQDAVYSTSPGTWIFVPRNVVHAWRCDSPEGKLLNVTVPAGFEEFYREVGQSLTDRGKLPDKTAPDLSVVSPAAAKHGVRIVGPPPDPSRRAS
jgi:mannose-6-phosphate isomerase-like protein (cupin superfamily)